MKADPNLEQEELQEEQKRLETIRSRMSSKDAEKIVSQANSLAAFQEAQENLSLDCLPKVSLNDVPHEPQNFLLKEEQEQTLKIFHTNCFTNHILYADLFFDLPHFSEEELPFLSLYTHLFTELGCGGRTYEQNLEKIEAYTGGADASLSLHPTFANPDLCKPAFILRIKALKRHTKQLFELLGDFAQGVDLTDEKRLKEWLLQHATELQNKVNKNALNYAVQLGFSSFSSASFVHNQWHGLPYFNAVQSWTKGTKWIEKLQQIQQKILTGPLGLILSCDETHFKELQEKHFYGLPDRLAKKTAPFIPWKGNYPLQSIPSQARLISSPVAFTAQTLRTCSYTEIDSARLLIAGELLDNVILHTEIREKGGAYGSGASYAPSTGNFYIYSYRDPNLSTTLKTFQQALEQIAAGAFDEEDLEEAKLGVIQMLDTPVSPGNRALTAYSWLKAGRTLAERRLFRKAILETTPSEVAAAVRHRLLEKPRTTITFLGQDLYTQEKEKLTIDLPLFSIGDF